VTSRLHGTNDTERPLRVLIVGGTSVSPQGRGHRETPETTLEAGLMSRGVAVDTRPHGWEISRRHWDIVHVHHLAHQALVQSVIRAGSRLVFTRHSTELPATTRRLVLELMYQRADALVVLSEAERKLLGQRVSSDRVTCIPNGIDGARWPYVQRRYPAPGEPWRLLFVGQLVPVKNVDVLLRAVVHLDPSLAVQLDLVFHNNAQEHELRRLAADLGIEGQVRFVGQVDHEKLPALYAQAHVLVLPSRLEALPSVITEAELSGVPVIASAVAGVPEQLDGHGTLVAPGDTRELTRAIARVFGAYDEAIRRAISAAASARSRYTIDAMIDGHLALYRQVLSRPSRRFLERRL